MVDALSLKLAALRVAPSALRRRLMFKRFDSEIERTGEPELLFLPNLLRRGDLAIDIGANLGTYSYAMARICGRVIAFEPNPAMARAIEVLDMEGVDVRCCAVADNTDGATLYLPAGRGHVLASLKRHVVANHAVEEVPVQTVRLDDLDLPHVSLIKIDVEGGEEEVLQGAAELLARDLPTLLIEIEERYNTGGLVRIPRMLAALGYTGHFFRNDWRPFKDFQANKHQNVIAIDHHISRRATSYVCNFLFAPSPVEALVAPPLRAQ